jgi:TPR repeat protein
MVRLRKRVELKDPVAKSAMAFHYGDGDFGLPVDQSKFIDLLHESAGLGHPGALYQLGLTHHVGDMGIEQNDEEALKYWKKAAEGGDVMGGNNAGCIEAKNDNKISAMRHWRLAASGGYRRSMDALIVNFEKGFLRHGDLAETLQAMYAARSEMKSEDRDEYIKHLKRTGKYEPEYEY